MLTTIWSSAQESFISLTARVVDSKSAEPVPFASVYLKGRSIGTTTNGDGRFLFHVPTAFRNDTLIISMIGYESYRSIAAKLIESDLMIKMKQSTTQLGEITIQASRANLSGKEVVRNAIDRIPDNYPMSPFMIEGFFRDLQKENDKPVELLEAAIRFRYKDYNPGFEEVDIIEVRRSYNQRHPVNGKYERQNAIIDLMEDNYVKHRFGPMKTKGWKFKVDSVLAYGDRVVYKVSGTRGEVESTVLYIDSDDFSILKLELQKQMVDGNFYRRYLNLPDPYGQQETSFKVVFEFQEVDNRMYLKYQREEDSYNLFNKTTNEIVLRQAFVKELFVNNVVTDATESPVGQQMNIEKSVEGQAASFNAEFWKYYNVPLETSSDSKIVGELENNGLKKDK